MGDRAGARAAIDEAVTIRRVLAEANPAAFTPDLADSLITQANRRSEVGDQAGARAAIDAAGTIYRGLAAKGLIRKDYLNGDAGTGGVYLWETRALAEAWFTEDRIVDLTKRFGVRPRLTWYDTHVTVDNQKGETRVNGKTLAEAD